MAFGTVPLSQQLTTTKVHELREPPRVLFTQVFPSHLVRSAADEDPAAAAAAAGAQPIPQATPPRRPLTVSGSFGPPMAATPPTLPQITENGDACSSVASDGESRASSGSLDPLAAILRLPNTEHLSLADSPSQSSFPLSPSLLSPADVTHRLGVVWGRGKRRGVICCNPKAEGGALTTSPPPQRQRRLDRGRRLSLEKMTAPEELMSRRCGACKSSVAYAILLMFHVDSSDPLHVCLRAGAPSRHRPSLTNLVFLPL